MDHAARAPRLDGPLHIQKLKASLTCQARKRRERELRRGARFTHLQRRACLTARRPVRAARQIHLIRCLRTLRARRALVRATRQIVVDCRLITYWPARSMLTHFISRILNFEEIRDAHRPSTRQNEVLTLPSQQI